MIDALIHAQDVSTLIPAASAGAVPEEIQYMPPGDYTITARDAAGKATKRTIHVNADTAVRLQSALEAIRARAAQGQEDLPYIDFNHEDGEAAGHVLEFRWAGDDPHTGGVRASIRWTEPGRAAIVGRAFRRFSPSFHVDADGEVIGLPVNMGGLVNRAAFKSITPIWSRAADGACGHVNQPKETTMDSNTDAAGLQAANVKLQNEVTELRAKLATAEQGELIKAKEAEISTLKARVAELETKVTAQARAAAQLKVNAAIEAGKLAPQATELHAKWVDLIARDESMAGMLDGLTPAPALNTQVTKAAAPAAPSSDAARFVELVHAKQAEGKLTKGAAVTAVITAEPKLYAAWREADGKPSL